MSPPPRLLYVITSLTYGGAERELVQVASRLSRRGWPVEVVSMLPPDALVDELEAAGVVVGHLGMARGRASLGAFVRFLRLLEARPPAILHGFMVHANLLTRLARLFSPLPVVISTVQNVWEGSRAREWAYRLTDPLADLTTQVSRAGAELYRNRALVRAEKLEVVVNSVDVERFRPDAAAREEARAELGLAAEDFLWLAVGRLEPQKDYPNLLQALARLAAREASPGRWQVAVAGQGPLAAELAAESARLGLGGRLRFLGLRRDVPRLLAAADAFVLPSAWEGTPLALLEALAAGLPAVATAVGGNAEVLAGLEPGRASEPSWLVPAADPSALAGALERMMRLPTAERRALGEAGRRSVAAGYGLEATADRWEAIYRRLLAEARSV